MGGSVEPHPIVSKPLIAATFKIAMHPAGICCQNNVVSTSIRRCFKVVCQSELPRPMPRRSIESYLGCTSRIYFENRDENVRLTLHNATLISKKTCQYNNKCDCRKTNAYNEVYVFQ